MELWGEGEGLHAEHDAVQGAETLFSSFLIISKVTGGSAAAHWIKLLPVVPA